MIVGIDGNEANQNIRVGSGVYAYNLLWQINRQCQTSRLVVGQANVKCQIYLKNTPLEDLPKEDENWKYKIVKPQKFWTQIGLPFQLWKENIFGSGPDIFFSPSHYAPRFCPIPSVITIFDLSFIKFPDMFLKEDLFKLKSWTEYSLRSAKKIITISQFSKKEIIEYYKIPKEKVVVAYPGYDRNKYQKSNVKNQKHILKIKNKYKIIGDYIIYVGTVQPRKNLIRLFEAFKIVNKEYPKLKLVICGMIGEGRGGWMSDEILHRTQNSKLKIQNSIIMTGYVSDEDLPYLISGAKALVLPSLYEGFGIPVIESMACGVPTVVSNISSLPEIAGGAGIFVDPYDARSIAQGIKEACYNKSKREEIIKKGLIQVQKFSWSDSARTILNTIKCLC